MYTFLVLLTSSLEHELSRIESLKELFCIHDTLMKSIDEIKSKLAQIVMGKAKKLEPEKPKIESQLSDKEQCLEAFYKVLPFQFFI